MQNFEDLVKRPVANDNGVASPLARVLLDNGIARCKTVALKAVLSMLHYSGIGHLGAPLAWGRGIIFTLHSVSSKTPEAFNPNGILRVTPRFLEQAIAATLEAGYDIVSLDEAARRIKEPAGSRPFACFTFDDGYRDNRDHAYPIFKRLGLPFAIYVPTDYPEGRGELWWLVLEEAIRQATTLKVILEGRQHQFAARTAAEKTFAFGKIYWALRKLPEAELRAKVREIAADAGYDPARLCADEIMTWDEIRALAEDRIVTIGAHTRRHLALAKLPADGACAEVAESVAIIEAQLGRPCRHFSYPYGDATSAGPRDFEIVRQLGLLTAVTTRKKVICDAHVDQMTALPRVSLNGDFQKPHYVSIFLTGVPFALLGLLGRLRARLRGHATGVKTPVPQAGNVSAGSAQASPR